MAALGITAMPRSRSYGESCKAFREGLQRAPGSMGLLQGLAISLGQTGEHRQVVDLLTPIADEGLAQTNHGDNELADLLLELGNAHHALGEKDRALQRWQEGTHGAEGEKRLFIGLNIAQACGDKQFTEAEQLCQDLELYFRPMKTRCMRRESLRGEPRPSKSKTLKALSGIPPTQSASTPTDCCLETLAALTNQDIALKKP